MVKRRRKSFERAHSLLEELRILHQTILDDIDVAPHKLQPLRSLQKLLIKEISRAERKIRRCKSILKTFDVTVAKEATLRLEERIEGYRHLAYIWRCFGDAIAFLFMDKFALKQTFFNAHNLNAKQDAGFLAGKQGLFGEWRVMEKLLERGIPALLTDLTNTIRHGDVCIMIGPDPYLIEVKSGKLDRRGKRQQNSIRRLMKFFETDEAAELRGLKNIRRVVHNSKEVVYIDEMNECIAAALRNGSAWRSPEDGLYYVAIIDDGISFEDLFAEIGLVQPIVFFLNEFKARRSWSPYSPFTLSIRNRDALFQFIWGDIYLAIFYEPDALRRLAASQGYKLEFLPSGSECAVELTRTGYEGQARMASQMFVRLALDFTSPAWLLGYTIENFHRLEAMGKGVTQTTVQ